MSTEEAREAAWDRVIEVSYSDTRQRFEIAYDAGVVEGRRLAREAVANASDVTSHKWRPEGEDYPSIVIHSEETAKAVIIKAIDALDVNT